jgi:hypothetical protein
METASIHVVGGDLSSGDTTATQNQGSGVGCFRTGDNPAKFFSPELRAATGGRKQIQLNTVGLESLNDGSRFQAEVLTHSNAQFILHNL